MRTTLGKSFQKEGVFFEMEEQQKSQEPYRLYLRNGVYHAYVQLGGCRRIRRSLGTTKQGLARKRLHDLVAKVSSGVYEADQTSITLDAWKNEYVETHLNQRVAESRKRAVQTLEKEIIPALGRQAKLSAISISQLIRLKADLWGAKGIPTQNRKIALVKHFFSEAKRRGLIKQNPADGLQKKRENPHKSRVLSDAEVQRLWFACGEPLRTFVLLGLTCGLRPAELQQLRWKHIEPDKVQGSYKVHLINAADLRTKSGKNREIPIHPKVVVNLFRLRDGRATEDLVFQPANGGCYYHHRRAWNLAKERAGLTEGKVTLYSLRRSFGSTLQRRGVSMMAIRDLYGHFNITTTQRYLDTSNEQLREAVEQGMSATVAFLEVPECIEVAQT